MTGMRKAVSYVAAGLVVASLAWVASMTAQTRVAGVIKPTSVLTRQALGGAASPPGQLIVVAWNNLGMHCINSSFKDMAILPPYNTLMAQVILKGNQPQVVTAGLTVEYEVQHASLSQTDFWQYAKPLFGADLAPGVGLTGNGLKGKMTLVGDHFEATGIPVIPWNDKGQWNPWQSVVVTVRSSRGVIKTVPVVLPVSDELHCDKCHADNGDAHPTIATGAVETNILSVHDAKNGTTLMSQRPVLCANCHADPALGAAGQPGRKNLSLSMHGWHGAIQGDQPACYDCHPGANTQCQRTAIVGMGPDSPTNPNCEKCHGTLTAMAAGLANGRTPWAQEPTCEQCHGPNYSTGATLYRNAVGPCGLHCATCHNSPHAWWPANNLADDLQPLKITHEPYAIGADCKTCHTKAQSGTSPHVRLNPVPKK